MLLQLLNANSLQNSFWEHGQTQHLNFPRISLTGDEEEKVAKGSLWLCCQMAVLTLPALTAGVERRRSGESPPGGERAEAEPFCKRLGVTGAPPWRKKWGEGAQPYAPQHPPAPSVQFWGWMAALEASSSSRVLWPRLALAWSPAGGCSRTL